MNKCRVKIIIEEREGSQVVDDVSDWLSVEDAFALAALTSREMFYAAEVLK